MDEAERMGRLLEIERGLWREGHRSIAGIDEAGRGPLAGPVVAAACILPVEFDLPGLNDSKKLSEKKRKELAEKIKDQAVAYAIGSATASEIDLINILNATKLAMTRALDALQHTPDYIIIDGRDTLNITLGQRAVIGGDGLSASIAAASILAKVTRDALMDDMHRIYPEYCFDRHKGYGTAQHLAMIERFGPCQIHRQSFSPIKEMIVKVTG
ncbi:ribonuclease HII [Dehalobacter sp. DCM]|uniref:ribonuclease HII n=1 Tax=Dehalobacter sp. DCM TaxID=2907827 RepID=UPI003081EE8E|nr:ribonuclease HII [Dehalobacter sp. DCM]